jgi:hypothetical protein
MINDFALNAAKVLMIISATAALISPLLFREGGLFWGTITRKGIVVMSICFGILLFSVSIAIWINNPSQSLTALTCGGGGAIILGIYFVILYIRLPHAREKNLRVQRERQKSLRLMRERQENLHKDKDSKEE